MIPRRDFADDLTHPLGAAELDALHEAYERGVVRDEFHEVDEVVPGGLRGDRQHDDLRVGERVLEVIRRTKSRRELDVGQVVGVSVGQVDGGGELFSARPEQRVGARVYEYLGESSAPRTGTNYCGPRHAPSCWTVAVVVIAASAS